MECCVSLYLEYLPRVDDDIKLSGQEFRVKMVLVDTEQRIFVIGIRNLYVE